MEHITPEHHTPFYCEENIWHLASQASTLNLRADAVFISNHERACPLYHQRACPEPGLPVVWDYHVILIAWDPTPQVFDLDCTLGAPLPFTTWWHATFPALHLYPKEYHPRFRLIDAATYHTTLCSDRSHMRRDDGSWQAPPPPWPAPNPHLSMNLSHFIDMTPGGPGRVLDAPELLQRAGL